MKRILRPSAAILAALLALSLVLVGCDKAADPIDTAPTTTAKYYSITGYTTTEKTGSVLAAGVTRTSYTMNKLDETVVAKKDFWGEQTKVGIKDNKLHVIDVNPSLAKDTTVALGLPNGKIRGLADTAEMAAYIEDFSSDTVIAGVNADFFDTKSGGPLGFSMKDGRWLTTGEYTKDGTWTFVTNNRDGTQTSSTLSCHPGYAFGIKKDGSAVIDIPVVTMTFGATRTTGTGDSATTAEVLPATTSISILNALRADSGANVDGGSQPDGAYSARLDNAMVLYTPDYYTSTKAKSGGVEVAFSTSSTLKSNGTVSGKVAAIYTTGDAPIYPGTMVLSACATTDSTAAVDALNLLAVGDTITVSLTVNEAWKDVVECVGGGRSDGGPLLAKDGAVNAEDFSGMQEYASGWYGNNPRTAVGIRADGSYFFFVVDGRWYDNSLGATIAEMSQIAVDLGAKIAINLDGGGSTTMITASETAGTYTTINRPAYKYLRDDGNAVYVVKR